MLASESKLSRFTATNRTITAPVHQAMKNSKGQEHQMERDKKLAATAEGEKSEYPNHASAFFFQLKVKLPQLSNLGNTRRPQNLHKKNNLHVLLYVSYTMTKLFTILLSVQSSFLVMPALSQAMTSKLPSLLFCTYFYFFFLLLNSMKSQANEEDAACKESRCL